MNKMNMPGFTAEGALKRTAHFYPATGFSGQTGGAVQPALFLGQIDAIGACFIRCMKTCVRYPDGQVSRDCRFRCAEACGGAVFIPSTHAFRLTGGDI